MVAIAECWGSWRLKRIFLPSAGDEKKIQPEQLRQFYEGVVASVDPDNRHSVLWHRRYDRSAGRNPFRRISGDFLEALGQDKARRQSWQIFPILTSVLEKSGLAEEGALSKQGALVDLVKVGWFYASETDRHNATVYADKLLALVFNLNQHRMDEVLEEVQAVGIRVGDASTWLGREWPNPEFLGWCDQYVVQQLTSRFSTANTV